MNSCYDNKLLENINDEDVLNFIKDTNEFFSRKESKFDDYLIYLDQILTNPMFVKVSEDINKEYNSIEMLKQIKKGLDDMTSNMDHKFFDKTLILFSKIAGIINMHTKKFNELCIKPENKKFVVKMMSKDQLIEEFIDTYEKLIMSVRNLSISEIENPNFEYLQILMSELMRRNITPKYSSLAKYNQEETNKTMIDLISANNAKTLEYVLSICSTDIQKTTLIDYLLMCNKIIFE